MTLPAPFQSVFNQWANQGIRVKNSGWTTSLHRHVGAQVLHNGELRYAKLALARRGDLDEPDMLDGMRREVWWSQVIQKLREHNPRFPFTSPRVFETNVNQQPFEDETAWVIMEYIEGQPIVDWEAERTNRDMNNTEAQRYCCLLDAVIASLLALEEVRSRTVEQLGLPPLPSPPHGMRGWQKKGLLDMKEAVLGNGAFEIKNFWYTPGGQLVVMDNEFAGWYPKYDHLSYLYHRLYCNTVRPDLARLLLRDYMKRAIVDQTRFFRQFSALLKPRLLRGWYYDTVRRWLPPWHKKQRLRYGLYWSLLRGRYNKLISDCK